MEIIKQKFTQLEQAIWRFLCIKTGLTFNARELAKYLDVSTTAIIKSIPRLEQENLIHVRKVREDTS